MRLRNFVAMVAVSFLVACGGDDPVVDIDMGTADADVDGGTDSGSDGAVGPDLGPVCAAPRASTLGENFFTEISLESGITDENYVPNPPSVIPLNDHSRIGMADINGDGCDDAFMHSLFVNWTADNGHGGTYMIPFEHLVFLGHCDGTFTNFSDESGLRDVQAAFFVFGDVDNDGDQDCYAGLDTPIPGRANVMLMNDGQGHFTPRTGSGVEGRAGNVVAGNAVFGDFNNDAHLDLFVGNGQTSYAAPDNIYLGNGDGTFTDATSHLSGNANTVSNGSVACDFDNDGDLDIYVSTYGVSNAGGRDMLWENDGSANFTNVAIAHGVSSLATGNYWLDLNGIDTSSEPGANAETYIGGNGFGVQCEDVDNDGDLDIFLANISHPVASDYSRKWSDPTELLSNGGAESGYTFTNEFLERGLPFNEGDCDAAMVDFDNDGLMDLALTRDKKYQDSYSADDQRGIIGLMHQMTNGNFESVSMRSGLNTTPSFATISTIQSIAWADVDRDGDLDALIGERYGSIGHINQLFRNDAAGENSWLQVRLVGDGVHVTRDAFGARVSVLYNGFEVTRELKSSRGTYSSHDSRTLQFGLGAISCGSQVRVQWPDGTTVMYTPEEVGTNRAITISYTDGISVDGPHAGVIVADRAGRVTTEAGGTTTFAVSLRTMPAADVTVALSSSNEAEGTVSPATLTFTAANWNTPQVVTVTGVDDSADEGDVVYTIALASASTDAAYNELDILGVFVTNTDNDFIPYMQNGYLKASNTGESDSFSRDAVLSADGNTLVVSAISEASNATGIGGDQTNNGAAGAGAVYVFTRVAGVWTQQAYIKASNTEAADNFGAALAISASGNTLVVGASAEASSAVGIDGDQANNLGGTAGAAYVFVRTGTTWAQQAYVKASNTGPKAFGSSVAVSMDGNTLAIGAPLERSSATGINGDQADDMSVLAGAVYVFTRAGIVWTQQAYVKASNTNPLDQFGASLALSSDGNTLAVGAADEDSAAVGIGGDQADNTAENAGAVYIYTRAATVWTQQAYVKASNTGAGDHFGGDVVLSSDGNTLVVGAASEASNATGVGGTEADNTVANAGAVYAFTRAAGVWTQQAYIKASNTGDGDNFGGTLALSNDGNILVVGARHEASNAIGFGGDQSNNDASGSGAVYSFARTGSVWAQTEYLKSSNTDANDLFGVTLAVSSDASTLVVGAQFEDSNATGIGGDQTNNGALDSGALYVFGAH